MEAEPQDRETEPDSFVRDPGFPRCMSQYFIYLFAYLRQFEFALVSFRERLLLMDRSSFFSQKKEQGMDEGTGRSFHQDLGEDGTGDGDEVTDSEPQT